MDTFKASKSEKEQSLKLNKAAPMRGPISEKGNLQVDNNLAKPQNLFLEKVDNSYFPFVPQVQLKAHSVTPGVSQLIIDAQALQLAQGT
jgi:hypothetical protein